MLLRMDDIHKINEIEELLLIKEEISLRVSELEADRALIKEKRAVTDKKYYMEKALQSNLNFLITREKRKWDNLLIVDGFERAGKSTLSRQIGYYVIYNKNKQKIDKFQKCKNIFFDPEDVLNFAKKNRKEVIVWDEAALGAMAEDRFDEVQKTLVKLLMTCAKYQHFLIFVIPNVKKLLPYFIERAIGLVRVEVVNNIHRGNFSGYGKHKLERVYNYEKGKTRVRPLPDFRGKFLSYENTDKEVIDLDIYEKRKDYAIENIDLKKSSKLKDTMALSKLIDIICKKKKLFKKKDISAAISIPQSYISNLPTPHYHKDEEKFISELQIK